MVVFESFFDASGHQDDKDCRVVTVGGCASTDTKWEKFELEWRRELDREHISIFHMKEFAHSTGQFEGWKGDESRRRRFIAALHRVILSRTSRRFSATVLLEHYRKVDERYQLHEHLGQPYTVAAHFVMTAVNLWMRANHPNDGMLYAFEKGDTDEAEMRQMSSRLTFLEVEPLFIKKDADVGVPLQAADFVAYEHAKMFNDYLKTGKKRVRGSAFPLMPRKRDRGVRFMDAEMLMMLVRDLRIPRRRSR